MIFQSIPPAATATTKKKTFYFSIHYLRKERHHTKYTFHFSIHYFPSSATLQKTRFLMHYFRSKRHQTKEKFDFPLRVLVSQQDPTNKEIHRTHFVYIYPFPARATRQERALAFRLLPSLPSKSHQSDNTPVETNTYIAD